MLTLIKNAFNTLAFRVVSVAGLALLVFYKIFRLGVKSQQSKQYKATCVALKERAQNDKKIKSRSNSHVRSELSKWVHENDDDTRK